MTNIHKDTTSETDVKKKVSTKTESEWQASILAKFPGIKKSGKGYVTRCPAHDDKNPSLTIYFNQTTTGGKADITCRSNKCSWESILTAAGLEKKDVYFSPNNASERNTHTTKPAQNPPLQTHPPKKQKAFIDFDFDHPTAAYSYRDESGQELYQNCRFETDRHGNRLDRKTFKWRHKTGDQWQYSLDSVRRVPYNFPALIAEPNLLIDTEGEKDADVLNGLGITATSTGKEAFTEIPKYCKGKIVVVCEDNDKPGRDKALEKAEAYWKAGALCVKIMTFRDMPEKSDITDWIQADPDEHEFFAIQTKINDTPDFNPLSSVIIDFFREITPRKPLIKMGGRDALQSGNIGGLVAGIGQGKSHFAEIIASTAINPGCEPDSDIEVFLEPDERIALLDTEQPGDDCKDILLRAWRRVGQKPAYLTDDKREFRQLSVLSLIDSDIAQRREKLLMTLQRPDFKLIIVDGLLDFVSNPNDPVESANFVLWLHTMAARYDKGVFCILHGNRDQTTGKGKGWLGDVFQRKAVCFLMLRKHKANPSIRVVTTDFDNAKMRKGDDSGMNIAMQWNNDLYGFRCLPYPEENSGKPSKQLLFSECFHDKPRMLKKELVNSYAEKAGVSTQTAYRHINESVPVILQLEQIGGNVFYQLGNIVN